MASTSGVGGAVVDRDGRPIAGATVRVRGSLDAVTTGPDGRFVLAGVPEDPPFRVTAWKAGHYVAGVEVRSSAEELRLTLETYDTTDHPHYSWIPPMVERTPAEEKRLHAALDAAAAESLDEAFFPLAEHLELGCRDCHGDTMHERWATSAHALGARNPIFLTMYNGTDVAGNRSPPTRRRSSRDYGELTMKPRPGDTYFGPGYKLDFPDTAGNCATCHLPAAALHDPYGTDPNAVTGVDASASHCDFCHKIGGVVLDPETGRPPANRPGVLSLEMVRPGDDRQIFFGPYDDVDVGPDTYLPLMSQSEICAPCHDASFWGVPIYESFAEWLASPYAARGETCQDCHMRPDGVTTNFAPGRGGIERDPATIPTHGFPGAADEALLREAVTMRVAAERRGREVVVTVSITNDRTGHHVPTDSPLRHLILLVRATDEAGEALPLIEGPKVPDWAGPDRGAPGHYGGLPGTAFAKILQEVWTRTTPTAAYWNPTRIVQDNRISAFETDTSRYRFAAAGGRCHIEATLLFRRAFIELAELKGWDATDIVMARERLTIEPEEG